MDFGRAVVDKKDEIIQDWMVRVRADDAIKSSRGLNHMSVLDSLPRLIDAIAHLLSQPTTEDLYEILRGGMNHGVLRAQQGFDAKEIVREYDILRDVIFDLLEPELLKSQPVMILRTVRLIDGAIDKVIATCLDRYTEERLKEVNLLYDEMIASNQELDRLVRNEQTNLIHLAHELKSPLSCIIGYSDLFLRQQDSGGEAKLSFIERVLASGRQLLEMINETLEMSSNRRGQIVLKIEEVNVCSVVEEVAAVMSTLAQQKNLSVVINCPTTVHTIQTDRSRLRQVVTNLLSNAVRYTEEGNIRVGVLEGEGSVEIAIADTGLGISDAEQDRIFEPYYQGEAGQQQPSSTGLGLAIAYQMVKLLQGSIHLKSEPKVGSTFTIVLPQQYQAEDPNLGKESDHKNRTEDSLENVSEDI